MEEDEPVVTLLGAFLALAQLLVVKLPDGPARAKTLDALEDTKSLAIEAARSAC